MAKTLNLNINTSAPNAQQAASELNKLNEHLKKFYDNNKKNNDILTKLNTTVSKSIGFLKGWQTALIQVSMSFKKTADSILTFSVMSTKGGESVNKLQASIDKLDNTNFTNLSDAASLFTKIMETSYTALSIYSEKYRDDIIKLQSQLKGTFGPAAGDQVVELFQDGREAAASFTESLKNDTEQFERFGQLLGKNGRALREMVGAQGKSSFGEIADSVKDVNSLISVLDSEIKRTITDFIANNQPMISSFVKRLVESVRQFFEYIKNNQDTLKNMFSSAVGIANSLADAIRKIADYVKEIPFEQLLLLYGGAKLGGVKGALGASAGGAIAGAVGGNEVTGGLIGAGLGMGLGNVFADGLLKAAKANPLAVTMIGIAGAAADQFRRYAESRSGEGTIGGWLAEWGEGYKNGSKDYGSNLSPEMLAKRKAKEEAATKKYTEENTKAVELEKERQRLEDEKKAKTGAIAEDAKKYAEYSQNALSSLQAISAQSAITGAGQEKIAKAAEEALRYNSEALQKMMLYRDELEKAEKTDDNRKALSKVRADIEKMNLERLQAQHQVAEAMLATKKSELELLQTQESILNTQLSMYESIYGTAAMAAEATLRVVDTLKQEAALGKQIYEQYRQKRIEAEKTGGINLEMRKTENKLQNDYMQKQLTIIQKVKELRDGYLDAVQQQAIGIGSFNKLITTAEQNVGMAQAAGMVRKNFLTGIYQKSNAANIASYRYSASGAGFEGTGGGAFGARQLANRTRNVLNQGRLSDWQKNLYGSTSGINNQVLDRMTSQLGGTMLSQQAQQELLSRGMNRPVTTLGGSKTVSTTSNSVEGALNNLVASAMQLKQSILSNSPTMANNTGPTAASGTFG